MNWEKLCSNLRFTVENKIGKLVENYVYNLEKWSFIPTGNFGHNTKFLTFGKASLILSPLYLNVNNANINSNR